MAVGLTDGVQPYLTSGNNTGIGSAAEVGLPQEFLDNLGDVMGDGEVTAAEALCDDGGDCIADTCVDGDSCSTTAAALFNTLASGIANNMNMAAGLPANCWELSEAELAAFSHTCIDPSEIMVTDITETDGTPGGGRRRVRTRPSATPVSLCAAVSQLTLVRHTPVSCECAGAGHGGWQSYGSLPCVLSQPSMQRDGLTLAIRLGKIMYIFFVMSLVVRVHTPSTRYRVSGLVCVNSTHK
jgi:hypothetical protein